MPMTIVVTRNVAYRYRGFLASCMLELTPGVYSAPRMSRAVRERVWRVMEEWWQEVPGACIVMTWPDRKMRAGQDVRILGRPPVELVEIDGIFLTQRSVPSDLLHENL